MAQTLLRYTACYFVILTICIDQGDGRWREKDKKTLKHDIEVYKRLAEKIERELKIFYDEYPEERFENNNVDGIHFEQVTNVLDRKIDTRINSKSVEINPNISLIATASIINISTSNQVTNHNTSKMKPENSVVDTEKIRKRRSDWPKFDDIVLAIGKKYDWKNDRWIKVRQKLKTEKIEDVNKILRDNNSVDFHEKHKFRYKMVKLNRIKSRRSVVVAVSAVR